MRFKEFLQRIFGTRMIVLQKGEVDDLDRREERNFESTAELLSKAVRHEAEVEWQLEVWNRLTPREQDVAALSCLRYTNEQIGRRLGIATTTVASHLRNVRRKLNVGGKGELRRVFEALDFRRWEYESGKDIQIASVE